MTNKNMEENKNNKLLKNELNDDKLLQALNWRYATKKYDVNKKLDENTLNILLESLRLTPSSLGIQPWKFLVIDNKEIRSKLKEAGFSQSQWTDASHLIIFCAKNKITNGDAERFLQSVAEQRSVTRESLDVFGKNIFDFIKVIKLSKVLGRVLMRFIAGVSATDWSDKQCYIALGNLLTSAAIMGVDASPMEGFSPVKFDNILGLDDYHTVVACALGYRDEHNDFLATAKKVRYSLDEVVKFYK